MENIFIAVVTIQKQKYE